MRSDLIARARAEIDKGMPQEIANLIIDLADALEAVERQEPAFWYVPADDEDGEDALLNAQRAVRAGFLRVPGQRDWLRGGVPAVSPCFLFLVWLVLVAATLFGLGWQAMAAAGAA